MARKLFVKNLIRKAVLEDWGLKLIALAITLVLWLGVTGLSTPTTKRLSVPLNLNTASNAQIINSPQQEVEIEISGDKRKIEQLKRSELTASIDLSEVAPGDRVVTLTPENIYVPLPQGVKLVEVAPSRIAVRLEAVEEKELEVKVETAGEPVAGYEVYSTTILPPRIQVRGPASIVRILEYVQTAKIDLSEKKEEFTARQIPVAASDPRAAVLNTFVDVVFRIGEKRIERPFTATIAGESGKTGSFVLFGPRTLLQKVKPADLKIEFVLGPDGVEEPRVILPPELTDAVEVRRLKAVR